MDKSQEAGEALMTRLGLLGVSVAQASREYGCEIHQHMFTQPNQKGLNTILHILLERVKGKEVLRKVSLHRQTCNDRSSLFLIVIILTEE